MEVVFINTEILLQRYQGFRYADEKYNENFHIPLLPIRVGNLLVNLNCGKIYHLYHNYKKYENTVYGVKMAGVWLKKIGWLRKC